MEEKIAVIRAGTMDIGASHDFAAAGYPAAMVDISKQALDRAEELIRHNVRY